MRRERLAALRGAGGRTAAAAAALVGTLVPAADRTSAATPAGHGPRLAVTNIADGETIRYPVLLLRGTAEGPGAVYVVDEDNPRPEGRGFAPIVDGGFVALVGLARGRNRLRLVAPQGTARLTVTWRPMTTDYRVHVAFVTGAEGDATYLTQFEQDRQNYVEKLDVAARLMQTVTAECMHEAGHGRLTFPLELDERGAAVVHTLRLSVPAGALRRQSGEALFGLIAAAVEALFPGPRSKCIAVMGFTRLDPETGRPAGHTARGGGKLALFGSGGMCAWPDDLADVGRVFSDATPVDGRRVHDDSNGRGRIWALASTTIGAMLHELGHTFGLPHVRDPRSFMSRGFDHLNRAFVRIEPPRRGRPLPLHLGPDAGVRWDPASAERLSRSPWFRPDGPGIAPPPPHRRGGRGPRPSGCARAVLVDRGAGPRYSRSVVGGAGRGPPEEGVPRTRVNPAVSRGPTPLSRRVRTRLEREEVTPHEARMRAARLRRAPLRGPRRSGRRARPGCRRQLPDLR